MTLSRRTVLRGVGLAPIAVGLPPLEAMFGRGAQGAQFPQVLVTFFIPNGIHPPDFWPKEQGRDCVFPESLAPLAPFASRLTLLQNLKKREWTLNQQINNDAHVRGHGTFATGLGITRAGAGGPSVDQVLAAKLGGSTKFRSLPVAVGRVADPRLSHISWAATDVPVPAERDPANLFARVFGEVGSGRLAAHRRSILDHVGADLARLQRQIGASDRARIDQHLTAVRELEREVERRPRRGCVAPPAPELGEEPLSNERARSLLRLLVCALSCDLTRFASFQLSHRADRRQFPWLDIAGAADGHHGISHLTSPQGRRSQARIVADEMAQLAYLLRLLAETPQGPGTLLDNALVFCANEIGEGLSHDVNKVPVILAGGAAGRHRAAGHRVLPPGTPYSNALVTVLRMFGLPAQRFGAFGDGPLRVELG